MPWFAVPVVIATAGLVGKLVSRHLRGRVGAQAIEDPPGVRTVARFELDERTRPADVLLAVAAELARDPAYGHASRRRTEGAASDFIEITGDAVRARAHPLGPRIEAVRLVRREPGGAYALELTRAWTGALLEAPTFVLLMRLHEALAAVPGVRRLAWHARQDRDFAEQHVFPLEAPPEPA